MKDGKRQVIIHRRQYRQAAVQEVGTNLAQELGLIFMTRTFLRHELDARGIKES